MKWLWRPSKSLLVLLFFLSEVLDVILFFRAFLNLLDFIEVGTKFLFRFENPRVTMIMPKRSWILQKKSV